MKYALATCAALLTLLWGCSQQSPAPEPVRSVKLLTLNSAEDQAQVGWAAEVRARQETRLSFRIGGMLTQRHIELGQRFKAGQLLAQLDPQDAALSSQAAQAQLASARVQRDLAAAELKRFEAHLKQGFIGQAEWDPRCRQGRVVG
ncbi:MAG: biotin/lipoyl-binding protein [Alphaproteobacteria bacterium]|nr:biotin/lipoyl-binding protein [Alphaproteobacteria bacterium]